jgi:hypothetical protein
MCVPKRHNKKLIIVHEDAVIPAQAGIRVTQKSNFIL